MEGVILDFNETEGVIRDHAGTRYRFAMQDWQSAEKPEHGALVDFEAEGNQARRIYLLAHASSDKATTATPAAPPTATTVTGQVVYAVTPPRQTSTLAVVSLVFGILGLFFFGSLIAVICGHMARAEIRRAQGKLDGDGMAVAGLVTGYLALILTLLLLLFFFGVFVFAGVASSRY